MRMLNQFALRKSHKALLATATGAAALLAPPSLVAYTQRKEEEQHQPTRGQTELQHNDVRAAFKVIMPALEASGRAMRLIGTASSILLDYQCAKYAPLLTFRTISSLGIRTGSGDGDDIRSVSVAAGDLEDVQRQQQLGMLQEKQVTLENKVTERAQMLWEAQQRYTATSSTSISSHETLQRAVHDAARDLAQAEQDLATFEASHSSSTTTNDSTTQSHRDGTGSITTMNQVHTRAAQKLVTLCRQNAGVYIKIGQHLANLDHLVPQPYLTALATLYNQAPSSPLSNVHKVLLEEFQVQSVDQLFDDFQDIPLASASLAQVHVARHKETGKKLAIKIQHDGLRETSQGDLWALEVVVKVVDFLCEDFKLGWLVEEIAPNLPKELDFVHEAQNSERAAKHLQKAGLGVECIVPAIHWDYTTARVLCMDFEEGYVATDVHAMDQEGISKRHVSHLISHVFQSQVFESGFVHCDPHPANVLWRKHPNENKRGRPQLVLVDHGLYKQLDDDFRITYAKLWKGLLLANIPLIKSSCERLLTQENRGDEDQEAQTKQLFPLLAAMLTSRPFDEIVERSKNQSIGSQSPTKNYTDMDSKSDTAMIRSYAHQYLPQIISMLDIVPRQMLLLFKLNDCLRHLDLALGSSPTHSLLVAGRYAVKAVYDETVRTTEGQRQQVLKGKSQAKKIGGQAGTSRRTHRLVKQCQEWWSYFMIISRIQVYELISQWWYSLYEYKNHKRSAL